MSPPPPAPPPAPPSRPRIVDAAVWSWLVAAVLTAALGFLHLSQPLPAFFRLVGVIWAVVGLGLGFLAGRARHGEVRFARAAVALALTLVVFDALLLAFAAAGVVVSALVGLIMLLLIGGCVGMTRARAQAWLAAVGDG